VQPHEVLFPAEPDYVFAVVECPTAAQLGPLLGSAAMRSLQGGGDLGMLDVASLCGAAASASSATAAPGSIGASPLTPTHGTGLVGARDTAPLGVVAGKNKAKLQLMYHRTPQELIDTPDCAFPPFWGLFLLLKWLVSVLIYMWLT
jgi:hypothetical protein